VLGACTLLCQKLEGRSHCYLIESLGKNNTIISLQSYTMLCRNLEEPSHCNSLSYERHVISLQIYTMLC
jgi:hypothetical protein